MLAIGTTAPLAPPGTERHDSDVGYNQLFQTVPDEFSDRCISASKPFPDYVDGDFVIPSIGLFELGDRKFTGFLDCFGKMQRFEIRGGKVCATYRMMATGFLNNSREAGTIAPGLLFFETEPPRNKPWYNPICNMPPFAPNDNTYVNTFRVGNSMLSLTDGPTMLSLDPKSMAITGTYNFEDDLEGLVCYTGSAHPQQHPATGEWIDFVGNGELFSEEATIRLFSLGDQNPTVRRALGDIKMSTAPYMHSFAVTENYVILPRMPVKFSAQAVAMQPMATAFQALELSDEGPENAFYIVPLDRSEVMIRQLPLDSPLWYVHTLNAFETNAGLVVDLTTSPQNPFAGDLTLQAARDKASRDLGAKQLVTRFVLPLDAGAPVTQQVLSDPERSTDFPTINPNYKAKEHCFYWAVEWFAETDSYASMAIVKHDICSGGEKRKWFRKNWYPSEATMVPSNRNGAAQDEGLLLFVALDGEKGETYLMGVDACTMELVSEAGPFPRIAFTTHGSFYPHV